MGQCGLKDLITASVKHCQPCSFKKILMGNRYDIWFMSSVSQCHCVFMNMALFNLVSNFSSPFNHSVFSYSLSTTGIQKVLFFVFVWLFVQGSGRESSARRAQIIVPFWGRNTPKWWWCTEQVNNSLSLTYSCQQINAAKSNLSSKMAWTSVRFNLLPYYLSLCTSWFI